jgi:hypothetical protein
VDGHLADGLERTRAAGSLVARTIALRAGDRAARRRFDGVRYVHTRFGAVDLVTLRDRLSILGVAVVAWFAAFGGTWIAYDSYAYWGVHPKAPYTFDFTPDQYGAFRYSPAVAQLFAVFHLVPWPVFAIGWMAFLAFVLAWMGRRWTLAVLVFAPLGQDLYLGNIEVLLAAAILFSFRWPGAWAFVLLTKVTPGVGLIWYVVRREWRNLAVALGVTGGVVAISFALSPQPWFEWPHAILAVGGRPAPWWIIARIGLAMLLIAWGARTGRAWTLIVGGTLAMAWLDFKTFSMLVGLVAFLPALPGDEPSLADELGISGRHPVRRADRAAAGRAAAGRAAAGR